MAESVKVKKAEEESAETAEAAEAVPETAQTETEAQEAPAGVSARTTVAARPGQRVKVPKYEGKVPEGQHFVYWASNRDGSGRTYRAGDMMRPSEAKDLYPVFRRD